MKEIIIDTLLDNLKLLPFLYLAFLIIEYIEHHFQNKQQKVIERAGKIGPLFGGLLGMVPQCGFGVLATNLYITRIISMGTLVAIYLSTSDEMLPIMISEGVNPLFIILTLLIKFSVGICTGFIIDIIIKKPTNTNYEICDDEHCHCHQKGNIFVASLIHTLKIVIFILIISFLLNCGFEYLGNEYISKILLKNNIFSSFITSLVGLIPNCGASVLLTELYLKETISYGAMIAGLLTGSGVAILVLFRSNKKLSDSFKILGIVYFVGAIVGLIIDFIMRF